MKNIKKHLAEHGNTCSLISFKQGRTKGWASEIAARVPTYKEH
jgi:hypothetical protein